MPSLRQRSLTFLQPFSAHPPHNLIPSLTVFLSSVITWTFREGSGDKQRDASQAPLVKTACLVCRMHHRPFSLKPFWLIMVGNAQGSLIILLMALFYSSAPVNRHGVPLISVNNTRTRRQRQLHGMQLSLILLFTPVLFLLWHVNTFPSRGSSPPPSQPCPRVRPLCHRSWTLVTPGGRGTGSAHGSTQRQLLVRMSSIRVPQSTFEMIYLCLCYYFIVVNELFLLGLLYISFSLVFFECKMYYELMFVSSAA